MAAYPAAGTEGQEVRLFFVSKNAFKHAEAAEILKPLGVSVEPDHSAIQELQTADTDALVRDKATKAFNKLGRPLFVEHTGLYLDMLNGLPGGLTEVFWETLKKDRVAALFASNKDVVRAVTHIGYVDGRRIHVFRGEVVGRIVPPRVDHGFQWDCVFKPDGYDQTFSEMGALKNQISMRRKALEKLREHLAGDIA